MTNKELEKVFVIYELWCSFPFDKRDIKKLCKLAKISFKDCMKTVKEIDAEKARRLKEMGMK